MFESPAKHREHDTKGLRPVKHQKSWVIYADTRSRHRTSFENVFTGTPNALARPKSPSLSSPLRLMRRFWGFKSRCRTWFSWQKAVPFNNWNMKLRTVFGSSAPRSPCWSMYFFRSCSQYSKIRTSFVSVCITSCKRTMLTCLSSFIRDISRMAVDGVPSSASRWISFNATISFVVLERPLKKRKNQTKIRWNLWYLTLKTVA